MISFSYYEGNIYKSECVGHLTLRAFIDAHKNPADSTIKIINEAREELLKRNIEPTQKKVMEITGFSIATIKRNWNII